MSVVFEKFSDKLFLVGLPETAMILGGDTSIRLIGDTSQGVETYIHCSLHLGVIVQSSLALLNRSPTKLSCCQLCLRDVTTSRARDALLYVCPISPNAWIQVKKSDWASLLS